MRNDIVKGFIGRNPFCTFKMPGLTQTVLEAGKVIDARSCRITLKQGILRVTVFAIRLKDGRIIPAVNAENQLQYLKAILGFEQRIQLAEKMALLCK